MAGPLGVVAMAAVTCTVQASSAFLLPSIAEMAATSSLKFKLNELT